MRIICLDVGNKRIGVAATDPLGIAVHGVEVIDRRGMKEDYSRIEAICRDREAERIVIGMPLDSDGGVGKSAKRMIAFADKLKEHLKSADFDIPIEMWDESYSTVVAEERLIGFDVSRLKRKRVIDKMAAVVILQDYLDASSGS